jgi:dihydroorotate dehydrogenase electron transfer subunit
MKDSQCLVKWHDDIGDGYFRLGFSHSVKNFQPGQFIMLKIPGEESLLRRPLSLCQNKSGDWEVVYKVIGQGTRILSYTKIGESLEILGPLGHPFSVPDKKEFFFVAGGYGIAPFLSFSQLLQGQEKQIHIFYGARTKGDLLLREDFAKLDVTLHISTDDGSEGHRGVVTEILEKALQHKNPNDVTIAACGPHGLLRATAKVGAQYQTYCEVSMETPMGCGSGVCLGCVVETKDHNMVRNCWEGPIFDATEILWERS